MSSPVIQRGHGEYVAGETHIAIRDRLYDGGRAILAAPISLWNINWALLDGAERNRNYGFADRGYLWITSHMGQTTPAGTFGNDLARTRLGQLRTYAQTALGAPSGKVHLTGISGGAAAAINYARQNPGNVQSIVGFTPLVDIQALRDLPDAIMPPASKAEIENAWGGAAAFTAAMPAGNPSASGNQAALAGIPILLVYSEDDVYIPKSIVLAYAESVNAAGGDVRLHSLGTTGHSILGLDDNVIYDFLADT